LNTKSKAFKVVDILYIALIIGPILFGLVFNILTAAPSDGIAITGAQIYFTVPMPFQDLQITESQLNSLLVMISLTGLCLFLTHGLSVKHPSKRQIVAEWIVEKVESMVSGSMGEHFLGFAPFIASIIALSAFSSLLSLIGLFPPTSDINISAGWAILVFFIITYYKMKCGIGSYLYSFCEPVFFLAPFNVISEFATPVSMAFRHYGNVMSGSVIAVLVASALGGLSNLLLGWLPGFVGDIPFLQIGIPAILSVYFDIFSGCLQAYIFAMLTMMYVTGAFDPEAFAAYKKKKQQKKEKKKLKKIKA